MYVLYNCLQVFHVHPEGGHYPVPKHVVVPYVENTLYSTNKYSCVRRVHTLYISYTHMSSEPTNFTYLHIVDYFLHFLISIFLPCSECGILSFW